MDRKFWRTEENRKILKPQHHLVVFLPLSINWKSCTDDFINDNVALHRTKKGIHTIEQQRDSFEWRLLPLVHFSSSNQHSGPWCQKTDFQSQVEAFIWFSVQFLSPRELSSDSLTHTFVSTSSVYCSGSKITQFPDFWLTPVKSPTIFMCIETKVSL